MGKRYRMQIVGQRFGRMLVVQELPLNKHKQSMWLCRCDCGTEKPIRGAHLVGGLVISCGCSKMERIAALGRANRTHGGSESLAYRSYTMMKHRCMNPASNSYHNYGGRGITICDRWLEPDGEGFANFLADMGPRPPKLTLERINNEGSYSPDNCRWATRQEQNMNTRAQRFVTISGITRPLREWIAASGWERSTVYKRIQRGMSIEQALRH